MERGTGSKRIILCACLYVAGGPGDWQQWEQGSHLSPFPRPPPTPLENKELAGALMEVTGDEAIWAVKFLLPFKRGPRGALGQGEASRSDLGVVGWALLKLVQQMVVIISHSLANLPFYQFLILHLSSLNQGGGGRGLGEEGGRRGEEEEGKEGGLQATGGSTGQPARQPLYLWAIEAALFLGE